MNLPVLQEILAYRNEKIPQHFTHENPSVLIEQSRQLFNDLLAWMWLSQYRKARSQQTRLFGPLLLLDRMWHCFILHTRDYHRFSEQFFGGYFHHDVEILGKEYLLLPEELAAFLEDCFDQLGEEWINRHFG